MLHGNNLYTMKSYADPKIFETNHDGQDYTIEIKFAKKVNDDPQEWNSF